MVLAEYELWGFIIQGIFVTVLSWWRHQMETFSALLVLCEGNSPVVMDSRHKGQWRRALMYYLVCARTGGWANNRDAGDFRRHRVHYGVVIMYYLFWWLPSVVCSTDEIWRCPCIILSPISVLRWVHYWPSQRTHDIIMTSLLRRNDVATL